MNDIMRGYPVPPENRVPLADWDRAPWNRWSFQHVSELLPTTEVWRGEGPVWELGRNPVELGSLEFDDADGKTSTLQQ